MSSGGAQRKPAVSEGNGGWAGHGRRVLLFDRRTDAVVYLILHERNACVGEELLHGDAQKSAPVQRLDDGLRVAVGALVDVVHEHDVAIHDAVDHALGNLPVGVVAGVRAAQRPVDQRIADAVLHIEVVAAARSAHQGGRDARDGAQLVGKALLPVEGILHVHIV